MSTNIEWTDKTWNPTTGCTKISPGCKNCYAARMAKRLKAMSNKKYQNGKDGFDLTLHWDMVRSGGDKKYLASPLRWKKPRKIFVNSMSDLFHEDVPLKFIYKVLDVCYYAHQHTFQILTKRSERLPELNEMIAWPSNVWLGVSVESVDYKFRIDHLCQTGAKVKFLSLEPLLGPLGDLDLEGIDWVIAGGESGPNCRPIEADWVRGIRDQCINHNVPFFFKQWGGIGKQKKENGFMLDGEIWREFPKGVNYVKQ